MTIKAKIEALLAGARMEASHFKGSIHDPLTLKHAILSAELYQEIAFLTAMLDASEDNMRAVFHARCAWRQGSQDIKSSNHDEVIAFDKMSESPTNQLYLAIAMVLFEPKDLQALVNVLLPNTKRCFRLTTPTVIPAHIEKKDYVYYMEDSLPTVTIDGTLAVLAKQPATAQALSGCVLLGDFIFPLQAMKQYGFNRQQRLYDYLKSQYPELSLKIYTHNAHLRDLEADILQSKFGFFSLSEAITALIHDLTQGDVKHSGKELVAGVEAELGKERFLAYYNRLPNDIKQKFDALGVYRKDGGENLALLVWRLHVAMESPDSKGSICVQVLSGQFNAFLSTNQGNPCLTESFHENHVKALREKYSATLVVAQGSDGFHYPKALASQLFSRIELADAEALLLMLTNIPPALYASLLENAWIKDISTCHRILLDAMIAGYFTGIELEAIIKKYPNLFSGVVIGSDENLIRLFSRLPANHYLGLVKRMATDELERLLNLVADGRLPALDKTQLCIALIKMSEFYGVRIITRSLTMLEVRDLFLSRTEEGITLFALAMKLYLDLKATTEGERMEFRALFSSASEVFFFFKNCPDARQYVNRSAFHLRSVFLHMELEQLFHYLSENEEVLPIVAGDKELFDLCCGVAREGRNPSHFFTMVTKDGRNCLHHAVHGDGKNVYDIIQVLPEVAVQHMLLQRDHEGNLPLSLARTMDIFLMLLTAIEPSKRLGALTDKQSHLILLPNMIYPKFGQCITDLLKPLMLLPSVDRPKFLGLSLRRFTGEGDIIIGHLLDGFIKQFFSDEILSSTMVTHEILVFLGVDKERLEAFNAAVGQESISISAMEALVKWALLESSSLNTKAIVDIEHYAKRIFSGVHLASNLKHWSPPERLLILFYSPGEPRRPVHEVIKQFLDLPGVLTAELKFFKEYFFGYLYERELCKIAVELDSACLIEELIQFHGVSESSLLKQAIIAENERIIDYLLTRKSEVLVRGSDDLRKMIMIYVEESQCQHPSLIGKLASYGADINNDDDFPTPLYEAISREVKYAGFTEEKRLSLVKHLIDHGANVNARSLTGQPYFSFTSDSRIAALLIQSGADVNDTFEGGTNLLMEICKGYDHDIALLVDLLIRHGLSRDLLDVKYQGAFSITPIATLIRRCKKPTFVEEREDCLNAVAILLKHGANPVVWCNGGDAYVELLELFKHDPAVTEILKQFSDKHEAEAAALQPVREVKDRIRDLSETLRAALDVAYQRSPVGSYECSHLVMRIRDFENIVGMLTKKSFMKVDRSTETLDTLKDDFRACYANIRADSEVLTFGVDPRAPGNRLIFDIANLLFQPKHMSEMLSILMPQVDWFPVLRPVNGNAYRVRIENRFMGGHEIAAMPVAFEALSVFVFYERYAFLVSALNDYRIEDHQHIYTQLSHELGRDFADRIYNHNESLRSIAKQLAQPVTSDALMRVSQEKDDLFLYFDRRDEIHFQGVAVECLPRIIRFVNAEYYRDVLTMPPMPPQTSMKRFGEMFQTFCAEVNRQDGFSDAQMKAIARAVFVWFTQGVLREVMNNPSDAIVHPVYTQELYNLYLDDFKQRYCSTRPGSLFWGKNDARNHLHHGLLLKCETPEKAAQAIQGLIDSIGKHILDGFPGVKLFMQLFPQFKIEVENDRGFKLKLG